MQISRGLAVTAICATLIISSAVGVTAKSMVPDVAVKQYPLHLFDAKGKDLGISANGLAYSAYNGNAMVLAPLQEQGSCVTSTVRGLHCYPTGPMAQVRGNLSSTEVVTYISGPPAWSGPKCDGSLLVPMTVDGVTIATPPAFVVSPEPIYYGWDSVAAKTLVPKSFGFPNIVGVPNRCFANARNTGALYAGYVKTALRPITVTYPLRLKAVG